MMGRRYGFTLIEMVVAVFIFLLFIVAVYGTYNAVNRSMAMAEDQEDLYQTGRILLANFNAELASAYLPTGHKTCELTGEDTPAATDALQSDRLTFLTTAHPAHNGLTAGDISRVTYFLGDETAADGPGLYLEENFQPGLEISDASSSSQRLLSPLVVGFNCKFLPADNDGWVNEWVDKPTLPVAVRVELTLRPKRNGAKPLVLVSTTNLALATSPSEGGTDAQP